VEKATPSLKRNRFSLLQQSPGGRSQGIKSTHILKRVRLDGCFLLQIRRQTAFVRIRRTRTKNRYQQNEYYGEITLRGGRASYDEKNPRFTRGRNLRGQFSFGWGKYV